MAQQLIFTSTPQGLEPGRTGYCTVARHKDLRHRLVRELERLSVYDFGQQVGANKVDISIFRKIALGSEEFYVLTKICDAGLDYTNRTNYLAHHLILDGFEIATCPSPAEIFLNWNGWKRKWDEGPRYLSPGEEVSLTAYKSKGLIPCKNWLSFTNDPGNAATLVSASVVKPVVLENAPNQSTHLLQLFAESCALLKISLDAWDYSFTTFLQGNDDAKTFAWLGIEGQPAGERLKQGGLRNYIDLQNWTSSSLSDDLDPSLSHIARKGPTAPPTKRVKSGTSSVTRSPLSQQTVQQIKGESSGYLSAAPTGSTVKAQEASTKKAKKKRPWLIQLAVISTALCLLGALIVGLVYNLGDWFNKEEKDPQEEKLVEVEVPENEPSEVNRPVVKGAFANLDQVEYLKISEKHPYLRWVSLDVGTTEPVKIKIKDDQFDRFEKALDQSQEGDELKVIISEKDGELTFDDLKKAPTPQSRGRAMEISFEESNNVEVSKDKDFLSFNFGKETFSYDLRRAKKNELVRINKLTELVQAGENIPLNLRLEGSRVVYIEPFDLPDDNPKEPLLVVQDEPSGPLRTISLKGADAAYYFPKDGKIQLPVDGGTERKTYTFKEGEEAERIRLLHEFLKKGEEEIALNIRLSKNKDKIAFLDFKLPLKKEDVVDNKPLTAAELTVVKKIIFWIPGIYKNGQWSIDDSGKSFVYEDGETADYLLSLFQDTKRISDNAKVWMTDYPSGDLFSSDQFKNGDAVEDFIFKCNISEHALDKIKIASGEFKTGKEYSFDFEITEGKSVEISYGSSRAKNSLNDGTIIRFPLPGEKGECVDIFLLSNKHAELKKSVSIGQGYSLSKKEISLSDEFLADDIFKFLTVNEGELFFSISAMNSSKFSSKVLFGEINFRGFIDRNTAKLTGLPTALIQLNKDFPYKASIYMDLDYFSELSSQILGEKQKYNVRLEELGSKFPDPLVYQGLAEYGQSSKHLLAYQPGTPFSSFVYNLPLLFIERNFGWDNVLFNNLKGELDLNYNSQQLASDSKLLIPYYQRLASEVEKFISDSVNKDFNYQEDKARRDISLLFKFLEILLKTEKALGVSDGNVLQELQKIRANLASPSPDKPFGLLTKETLSLSKTNPELGTWLKAQNNRYIDLQKKLVPTSKLTKESLAKAISTISDLGQNTIYRKGATEYQGLQFWTGAYGSLIGEIQNKQQEIFKSNPGQTADRFKKIISELPWTLAIYAKGGNGKWKKQSDFLRLAPPANL